MIVRRMCIKDIETAVEIEKQCFSSPWSKKSFEDSLLLEGTLFLVAEDDDKVIGYVGSYLEFDQAYITNVAVSQISRRMGAATMLLCSLEKELSKERIETIFLEVRITNTKAISLYEKNGYLEIGTRKNFYEKPIEDALVMQKKITK